MTDWISTTCMRCAVGCGHVQHGADIGYGLDTVRGDPAHPVNRGLACQRGVSETADPNGEWLTQPLIRRNGSLQKTTWDIALTTVLEKFDEILDNDRDGIAVLGSGQQTNEAAYALGKLARGGFGTQYYDANTTLCMASAVTAYYDAFGSDAPPPTYDDIPAAKRHIVWGANPAVAHPVMFRWITDSADDEDSSLLVVDPVETETAEAADTHIDLDPGGDLNLARAVLAHAVDTDRVDEPFVADTTVGFNDLCAELPDSSVAADRAGVPFETVETLAAAFEDQTLVYWGMGVNQSNQGTDTAGALIDLCLATGNIGPGSGPFSLTGQANSMGTRVCSSKGTWPGHRDFENPKERDTVAAAWDVPVERLPGDTGPGPVRTIDAIANGPIEAVYAVATNPVAGMPDASETARNLEDVFLVVQDAFRTKTTDLADIVLPAATWGESNGTAINMERTVSRVRPATDLPGGVRTDLDIITTLGNALADELFGNAADPESIFAEFTALTEGSLADCSGISYDRLESELAVRWPAPDTETSAGYRYYDDGDYSFPTPSGNARFTGGTGQPVPEPPTEDYPLTLTTARKADGYNTGVRSRASPDDSGPLVARIHPETVETHLDPSNDVKPTRITIESQRGSVPIQIEADDAIQPGLVWLPIHHPATNELTLPETDPQSDEPHLKQCAVRLVADHDMMEIAGGERA
ncbi:nitrate reductase [halophilic archaeon]|nr:nitrate reductase [halophilic archaeon]